MPFARIRKPKVNSLHVLKDLQYCNEIWSLLSNTIYTLSWAKKPFHRCNMQSWKQILHSHFAFNESYCMSRSCMAATIM